MRPCYGIHEQNIKIAVYIITLIGKLLKSEPQHINIYYWRLNSSIENMWEHNNAFTISEIDIQTVFDQASRYYVGQGFTLINQTSPNMLVLERGRGGMAHEWNTLYHKVTITLNDSNGLITINTHWVYPKAMATIGDYKRIITSEIEKFHLFLLHSTAKTSPSSDNGLNKWFCQDCGTKNFSETQFCGKCGNKKR